MSEWNDGFRAGWYARDLHGKDDPLKPSRPTPKVKATQTKSTRKASAANKRYGAAFKRLAPKYKKKGGGWKKDGFKRCAAAARKAAKK